MLKTLKTIFDRNRLLPRSEQALCQGCGAAQNQRLGKVQFEHTQQNEQEVDGHGAVDAGQLNFETGSENRDQQVAEKSAEVDTLPVPKGISQRPHAERCCGSDKQSCANGH